jgi:hypothetical protein
MTSKPTSKDTVGGDDRSVLDDPRYKLILAEYQDDSNEARKLAVTLSLALVGAVWAARSRGDVLTDLAVRAVAGPAVLAIAAAYLAKVTRVLHFSALLDRGELNYDSSTTFWGRFSTAIWWTAPLLLMVATAAFILALLQLL